MIGSVENEANMTKRHLKILKIVINSEPIGIVTIANNTSYPHHKVRYSLRILEEENLIEPSSQGATTTGETDEFIEKLNTKIDQIESKLIECKSKT
jgi:Uncharacterized protein conserved in archaea